jgi:hypothetical protein
MSMLYYLSSATTWKEFKDNWVCLRATEHVLGHHKPFGLMPSNEACLATTAVNMLF